MWQAGRERLAGTILAGVGALLLAERFAPDLVAVLAAGAGALAVLVGLILRSGSLLALGGVLAGAGAGLLLAQADGGTDAVARLLAGAGAGLAGAAVLAGLLRIGRRRLRALLLGAAVAAVGVLLPAALPGAEADAAVGDLWPVALVAAGLLLLVAARPGLPGPDDVTALWPLVADDAVGDVDADDWAPGPPIRLDDGRG